MEETNHNMDDKIFKVFWKSKYSVNKNTIDNTIVELDKSVNYLMTSILPCATKKQVKKILKDIDALIERRQYLNDKKDKWSKTYDEKRFPTPYREVGATDSEKAYGLQDQRVLLSANKSDKYSKSRWRVTWDTEGETGLHTMLPDVVNILQDVSEDEARKLLYERYGYKVLNISRIEKTFHKSIDNKQVFTELYINTWGSDLGIPNVDEMSDDELIENINALKKIFEKHVAI